MPKKELHFSIEGTTPHTFPMARLADYLRELATLLRNEDNVHFLRVDDGSANCAMEIDAEIEPTISERVRQAQKGIGVKEAAKAFKAIRLFLDEDDTSAFMEWDKGEVLIKFRENLRHRRDLRAVLGGWFPRRDADKDRGNG